MNSLVPTGGRSLSASVTFNTELTQRFIKYIDAKQKTIETYGRAIRQLLRYLSENNITQPQREDIINYRNYLSRNEFAEHRPTTVQNYIMAARQFFKWLESEGLYPNVAEHIKGADVSRAHKRDFLSADQMKMILSGIDQSTEQGRRDYAMLALMVTCGLRTIEVIRANCEDLRSIATKKEAITVLYVRGKGQDEKAEYVKVSPVIERILRSSMADRKNRSGKDPLFVSLSHRCAGERLTTRSIRGIVKKHFSAAGFDSSRLTAHSLRHTAVTLALISGKKLNEAQQFARHANIASTMIYDHSLNKEENSCGEAVTNAIF
jgi:integrase/recombinase XerC